MLLSGILAVILLCHVNYLATICYFYCLSELVWYSTRLRILKEGIAFSKLLISTFELVLILQKASSNLAGSFKNRFFLSDVKMVAGISTIDK